MSEIIELVKAAARIKLLFLPHAVRQMALPDRMITVNDVRNCIFPGEVIEDYLDDACGRSCLMLGTADSGRPIHVVCAPRDGYLSIITAYQPDPKEWDTDWKTSRPL